MFVNSKMSVVAYANGFTLWQYQATDEDLKKICEPDYFAKIVTLCAIGDIIIIVAKDGTSIKTITKLTPAIEVGDLIK